MKKISNIALIALIILVLSCKDENIIVRQLDEISDAEVINQIRTSKQVGIPLPEGSEVKKNKNEVYEIKLPKGFFYVVSDKDINNTNTLAQTISITCKCSQGGGGCSPAKYKEHYFCIMNEACTNCIMTTTTTIESSKKNINILGLINKNAGITLISDQETPLHKTNELINYELVLKNKKVIHGNGFDALLKLEDVQIFFNEMANYYKVNNIKPNSYSYLNIYGNLVLMPYYDNGEIYEINGIKYFAKTIKRASLNKAKEEITCTCNEGNGCEKKSYYVPFLGTVYYCDAGSCTKCTLQVATSTVRD